MGVERHYLGIKGGGGALTLKAMIRSVTTVTSKGMNYTYPYSFYRANSLRYNVSIT